MKMIEWFNCSAIFSSESVSNISDMELQKLSNIVVAMSKAGFKSRCKIATTLGEATAVAQCWNKSIVCSVRWCRIQW